MDVQTVAKYFGAVADDGLDPVVEAEIDVQAAAKDLDAVADKSNPSDAEVSMVEHLDAQDLAVVEMLAEADVNVVLAEKHEASADVSVGLLVGSSIVCLSLSITC